MFKLIVLIFILQSLGCAQIQVKQRSLPVEKSGWLGADGASALMFSKKKRIWIFSDTYVGQMKKGKRVGGQIYRNSIGIEDNGRFKYYWNQGSGKSFFINRKKNEWYWPTSLFSHHGKLYVLLKRIVMERENDPLGFREVGTDLAIVENPEEAPEQWNYKIKHLSLPQKLVGVAAYSGKNFVYFLFDGRGKNHPLFLGRISSKKIKEGQFKVEIFSPRKGQWGHRGEPIISIGSPEASLTYSRIKKRWRIVFTPKGLSKKIVVLESETMTGTWKNPQVIYQCSEMNVNKNYFCYSAKEIPGESFQVTYNVNSFDFWDLSRDPSIYVPQILEFESCCTATPAAE